MSFLFEAYNRIRFEINYFIRNKSKILIQVFLGIFRYLLFTLLVYLVIKYQSEIEILNNFEDLETELIGALVVFILIDIPITISRVSREIEEDEKNQVVINYILAPILNKILSVLFYYLILPSKIHISSVIKNSQAENDLRNIRYDDYMKFYTIYHIEENEELINKNVKRKVRSVVFDTQEPKNKK